MSDNQKNHLLTKKVVTKTKRTLWVPLNRWTITLNIVLTGMMWCPLMYAGMIHHPARMTWLAGKIAAKIAIASVRMERSTDRAYKKYAPKPLQELGKRYESSGLADAHRMAEVASGRSLGAPKENVVVRGVQSVYGAVSGVASKL